MRRALSILVLSLAAALLPASSAAGAFGFQSAELSFLDEHGNPETLAGAHPYELFNSFEVNTKEEGGEVLAEGDFRDLRIELPPGVVADPKAVPRCSGADFLLTSGELPYGHCPDASAVGWVRAHPPGESGGDPGVIFNLAPPPGVALKLGFHVLGVAVTIEGTIDPDPPHNAVAELRGISNVVEFGGSEAVIWGEPADPAHDPERGKCFGGAESCAVDIPERAFLTLPRSCTGPLEATFRGLSWQGEQATAQAPVPAMGECSGLPFAPQISARPTSASAQSPSGLDFGLEVDDEGLTAPGVRAGSDINRATVALPVGVSINPSQAEGLDVCTEADLDRETLDSAFGSGCPAASKVGTIEVETPLLQDEILRGRLYVAEPYANLAEDSLIAVYVVIRDPELGILVTQPIAVRPDPRTGQLVSTAKEMPQLPFSDFRLRFREGGRSPLITPPGCGSFEVTSELTPWAGGPAARPSAAFEIASGPGGSACPSGAAPFDPGFEAGTLNNAAGRHSPFYMRLTRADGMQDLSRFSAVLPPGVAGRIAAIPWCPEAGIARARARSGEHGGQEELADPSCPAASAVGRTVAGAGVGPALTYVPGSLHLAGPFAGAPLSVVSITPAVAGPFDAGAVVVRVGLRLNPRTGVVEADGAASDPIPHILQGIPLNVRDLRVYADRPSFTLNATNCLQKHTFATLWGAGTALSPSFEAPVVKAARYQAAGCASLGFKPRLAIKLRGGVRRGAHPALRAVVTPRPGDANFARAVVTLPRSAFLDQAHIRTICTRVQFAAGAGNGELCPQGARYGYARAWSPLLDAPAQGPVYLRSSDNKLPDLVVALKGPASAPVDVELSARIDSVRGGIRSTFAAIPDLPVSRFVLDMQGGKKGLIVNSRHLCFKPKRNRAKANIRGQNGKLSKTRPVVRAVKCAKGKRAERTRSSASKRAER